MSDLAKALSSLDKDSLIQMAKSHCATKVSSVIINTKPLKAKVAELESFKSMEMVEALPDDAKQEMLHMFETAQEACREMSKSRKKY